MEFTEKPATADEEKIAAIEMPQSNQEPISVELENSPERSEISSELKSFFDNRGKVEELSAKIGSILADNKGLYEIPSDLEFEESGQLKKIKVNLYWGDGKLGKILHEKAKNDFEEHKRRGQDFAFRLTDEFVFQAYKNPENEAEKAVKGIIDEYYAVKMERRSHYEKLNENLGDIETYYGSFGNIYKFIYGIESSPNLDEKIRNFDISKINRYVSENKGKSVSKNEDYALQMKEYADSYRDIFRLLEGGIGNLLTVNTDKVKLDESQLIAQIIVQNLTEIWAFINTRTDNKELSDYEDQELKRLLYKLDKFKRMNLSGLPGRIDERI